MTATRQLPMNLSGCTQLGLPLDEDTAHREILTLADVPLRPVQAVRDVVLRVTDTEPYAPWVAGSETSQAAAESLSEEALDKQRRLVLAYLRSCGAEGAADFEIAAAHPAYLESSLRRARVGLVDTGYARDTGLRRLNPASDRRVVCWVAREYAAKGAAA